MTSFPGGALELLVSRALGNEFVESYCPSILTEASPKSSCWSAEGEKERGRLREAVEQNIGRAGRMRIC